MSSVLGTLPGFSESLGTRQGSRERNPKLLGPGLPAM